VLINFSIISRFVHWCNQSALCSGSSCKVMKALGVWPEWTLNWADQYMKKLPSRPFWLENNRNELQFLGVRWALQLLQAQHGESNYESVWQLHENFHTYSSQKWLHCLLIRVT
jgi:hypothetical protein